MRDQVTRRFVLYLVLIACSFIMSACENHTHAFGEWEIVKQANCTIDGEKVRYCSCGDMQTGIIVATGHTEVVDKAVEPNCTEAGLTEGKHCSVCNEVIIPQEIIEAKGHNWGNATCTTRRSCLVCWEEDADSEPIGHDFVNGECQICGADDTNSDEPKVTASATSLTMSNSSQVVYITLLNWDSIEYSIANSNIVDCEWGDWDGDTIPLTFIPISSGKTSVTVYPEGLDGGVTIYVSVEKQAATDGNISDTGSSADDVPPSTDSSMDDPPETISCTLTVDGIGEEYVLWFSNGAYTKSIINSAEYEIVTYGDTICIEVEVIATMLECNSGNSYIGIVCQLFDDRGICINTCDVWIDASHLNQPYAQVRCFWVDPGNYTLVFRDKNM